MEENRPNKMNVVGKSRRVKDLILSKGYSCVPKSGKKELGKSFKLPNRLKPN